MRIENMFLLVSEDNIRPAMDKWEKRVHTVNKRKKHGFYSASRELIIKEISSLNIKI
jgi:hypothetical protein